MLMRMPSAGGAGCSPASHPASSSGLTRGSATPLLCSAEAATPRVSRPLNPFTGCQMQRIPGSSPRMTMGVGECLVMEPRA